MQNLTSLAPQIARVEREGAEVEVPVAEVRVGETVVVRPGEMIPVDGEVVGGQATVDQAAITGESIPAEAGPGSRVFVATIAVLTYLFSCNPLAAAAVLVVACSCSFALATPVAMIAAIGSAARQGVLIKGGKYLEALSRAHVLLLDKTGTLTLGRPQITDIVPPGGSRRKNCCFWPPRRNDIRSTLWPKRCDLPPRNAISLYMSRSGSRRSPDWG